MTRILLTVFLCVGGTSCSDEGNDPDPCAAILAAASYEPRIDPAEFTATIANRYLPLTAGKTFRYHEGNKRVETIVTAEKKTVMGVECKVGHDVETMDDGLLLEDTYDWYAQDQEGNVWYFGEDTKAYQDGKAISTVGSWVAGVDCAQPGIVTGASRTRERPRTCWDFGMKPPRSYHFLGTTRSRMSASPIRARLSVPSVAEHPTVVVACSIAEDALRPRRAEGAARTTFAAARRRLAQHRAETAARSRTAAAETSIVARARAPTPVAARARPTCAAT